MQQEKIRLGIVGHGFVGGAVDYAFTHPLIETFIVDPKYDTNIDHLIDYMPDVTFICAPTPMGENGIVDASIVEDAALKLLEFTSGIVVIKSTVTPDIIDRLYRSVYEDDVKRLVVNPEFLTESNAKEQFVSADYHVIGGHPEATEKVGRLYNQFSLCTAKEYVMVSGPEAAFIKYGVNSFLALKVTFFNQLYDSVTEFGCSYNTCLLYTSPSPRDKKQSRMPSSA